MKVSRDNIKKIMSISSSIRKCIKIKGNKGQESNKARNSSIGIDASWKCGDIIHIYSQPRAFFEDLLQDIRKAKERIYLVNFVIGSLKKHEISKKLVEELKAAKKRGVDVRVRLDRISLIAFDADDTIEALKEAGIPVQLEEPISLKRFFEGHSLIESEHRKMFVIDGKAYLGGVCLTDLWYKNKYRDVMVKLKGDIVKDITRNVMRTWNDKRYIHIPTEGGTTRIRLIYTHDGDMKFKSLVLSLINRAKKSIYIENQYFVDEDIAKALVSARKRGIKVVLVVPKNKDDIANDYVYIPVSKVLSQDLVKVGAEVWRYKEKLLHTKLMVVDERYSLVGSHNFDYLSTERDHEASILIDSRNVAQKFIAHIRESIKHSEPETKPRWFKYIWGKLMNFLIKISPIGPNHYVPIFILNTLSEHTRKSKNVKKTVKSYIIDKAVSKTIKERTF